MQYGVTLRECSLASIKMIRTWIPNSIMTRTLSTQVHAVRGTSIINRHLRSRHKCTQCVRVGECGSELRRSTISSTRRGYRDRGDRTHVIMHRTVCSIYVRQHHLFVHALWLSIDSLHVDQSFQQPNETAALPALSMMSSRRGRSLVWK